MNRPLLYPLLALCLLASSAGRAQTIADCRKIGSNDARLACYDAAVAATQAAGPPIASYAGSGITSTRPFTVSGPWEARFSSTAHMSVTAYNASGLPVELFTNGDAGAGSGYSPQTGRLYLGVNTSGQWRVDVVSVP